MPLVTMSPGRDPCIVGRSVGLAVREEQKLIELG